MRTAGGFRLYGDEDVERVARMRRAIDEGLSAAEAARVALDTAAPAGNHLLDSVSERLLAAIESYDEAAAQAVLDDGLAAFGLEAFLGGLVLPTLAAVGRAWEQGTADISQEHFASNLMRGRLLSLARLWGRGSGPLALLACAPGEQHDIGLLAFGLVLRSHGWRILFLGTDTPVPTLERAANTTAPAVIVLVTYDTAFLDAEAAAVRRLGRIAPLFLSGAGASAELTAGLRVRRLTGDVIEAAHEVART